jgi:hypothetical protein
LSPELAPNAAVPDPAPYFDWADWRVALLPGATFCAYEEETLSPHGQ